MLSVDDSVEFEIRLGRKEVTLAFDVKRTPRSHWALSAH